MNISPMTFIRSVFISLIPPFPNIQKQTVMRHFFHYWTISVGCIKHHPKMKPVF